MPDDDLREMVTNLAVNFWVGPGGHVVSYSARSTDMFNIVFIYPGDLPADVSRKESSMEETRELFKTWDPTFVNISCRYSTQADRYTPGCRVSSASSSTSRNGN
jgi:hypothetical protein